MRELLAVLCSVAFLGYGINCLRSSAMEKEFIRYGLQKFRHLTGTLEILGGLGLLAGLRYYPLLIFSSSGLCLLMLLGLGVRLRLKDPWLSCLPAAILFALTLGIVIL